MKRILAGAVPFLAAVLMIAGPAAAATPKVSCKTIDAQLAAGKAPAAVAKELKVTTKAVQHCQTAMTSAHSGQAASQAR
ncbi:MAG: hypothetical protein ACRERC_10855 [Candidatus Binatia bacterium]